MNSTDYHELFEAQCHLTDLYRNQLQSVTYELHKSRATIQHLRAILVSLTSDLNLKSEHLQTLFSFLDKCSDDDQRISSLSSSFKASLSSSHPLSQSPSSSSLCSLPSALLLIILQFLLPRDLSFLSYTCKDLSSLCNSPSLWSSLSCFRWHLPLLSKSSFLARYASEMCWYHTRPVVSTLLGHSGSVTCLSRAGGSARFVSGSDDCSLVLWELDERGLQDQEIVKQHHVQTRTVARKVHYYGHGGPVWSCCVGPDNSLVSGSYDKTVKVWDLATGRCEFTMRGHSEWVSAVDCNAQVIVSGSWDASVRVWAQATKQGVATLRFEDDAVYCVQLQSNCVAVGLKNSAAEIWDLQRAERVSRFQGHFKGVNAVRIKGDLLFTASSDSLVKVWDVRSGEGVGNLAGHSSNVMAVDYDEEAMRVASGSYDKTVRIWDARMGFRARSVLRAHSDPVFCVAIEPHRLITGSQDQSIKLWSFSHI
jgi:WD40 repeat protein